MARAIVSAARERDDRQRAFLLERAVDGAATADDAEAILTRLLPNARTAVDTEIGVVALSRIEDFDAVVRIATVARESTELPRRVEAIEALGRSDAAAVDELLGQLASDPDARIRSAVITSLGERKALANEIAATAALDDDDWRVRSAAIWGLARGGWEPPDSGSTSEFDIVPALIGRLRRERGRLVDDCSAALAMLLGKRFGAQPEEYGRLWAERTGRAWETPGDVPEPPLPTMQSALLTTRSRNVLFVLYTGESMKEEIQPPRLSESVRALLAGAGDDLPALHDAAKTKLDLARVHLISMLRGLADDTLFDVAVYAGSPTFAFGRPTPADARSRKRAEGRIASLSPGGGGNLGEMLVRAFDPKGKDPLGYEGGPDTVILFSDGRLAAPGSTDRNQVTMALRRWNRVRQIRFLVVGISPTDDSVLSPLAAGPPAGVQRRIP